MVYIHNGILKSHKPVLHCEIYMKVGGNTKHISVTVTYTQPDKSPAFCHISISTSYDYNHASNGGVGVGRGRETQKYRRDSIEPKFKGEVEKGNIAHVI